MRNSNIKLHFNIMKIFKYLAFVFAFFMLSISVKVYLVKADQRVYTHSYENGEITIDAIGNVYSYDGYFTFDAPAKLKITLKDNSDCFFGGAVCGVSLYKDKLYSGNDYKSGDIIELNESTKIKFASIIHYGFMGFGENKKSAEIDLRAKPSITIDDIESVYKKEHTIKVNIVSFSPATTSSKKYCIIKDRNDTCDYKELIGDRVVLNGYTGSYTLKVRAEDSLGVAKVKYSSAILLDNTAPTIKYKVPTLDPSEKEASTYWGKTQSLANVEIEDNDSDIGTQEYCWSTSPTSCIGNDWKEISGLVISETSEKLTGIYYLHIRAADNVGNLNQTVVATLGESIPNQGSDNSYTYGGGSSGCGSTRPSRVNANANISACSIETSQIEEIVKFRFDNEAPTLNIEIGNSGKGLNSSKWTNETDFYARNIADNHSGLASARLQWKEGISKGSFPSANEIDLLKNNSFDWTTYISYISNGLYIKVILTDNVGNSRVETMSLYIDNVAPVVNIKTGVNKLGVQKTWLNSNDLILYEITIRDSNFKSMTYTNLSDKCEAIADTGTTKRNLTVKCDAKIVTFKLEYEAVDKAGNKNINSASYGANQNTFYFDTNGVILKDGNVEIGGTIEANGFFPSKSNTTKANLITYEIEEVELVDVEVVSEDIPAVVNDEEVKDIEVSANIEEHKDLDSKVIELGNSEICVTNIKFSYANEELKKLFVLNKKLNKLVVKKGFN